MASKFDWSLIAADNLDRWAVNLTSQEIALLLTTLNDRAIYRGTWLADGDPVDDTEWDQIEAMTADLVYRLMAKDSLLCQFLVDLDGFSFYNSTGSGTWTISQDALYEGSMKFDVTGEAVGSKGRARKSVDITIQPNHKIFTYFVSPGGQLYHARYRLRDEADSVIVQFGSGNKSSDGTEQFLTTWAGSVIKTIEVEAEVIETGGTIYFDYVGIVLV